MSTPEARSARDTFLSDFLAARCDLGHRLAVFGWPFTPSHSIRDEARRIRGQRGEAVEAVA
jgi:hypothetical protein